MSDTLSKKNSNFETPHEFDEWSAHSLIIPATTSNTGNAGDCAGTVPCRKNHDPDLKLTLTSVVCIEIVKQGSSEELGPKPGRFLKGPPGNLNSVVSS